MTTAKMNAFPNSSTSVKSILTTCIESRLWLFMVQHYGYWIKSLQEMESLHSAKQVPSLKNSTLCAFHVGEQRATSRGRKGKAPIHKSRTPPPFPEINSGEVINRPGGSLHWIYSSSKQVTTEANVRVAEQSSAKCRRTVHCLLLSLHCTALSVASDFCSQCTVPSICIATAPRGLTALCLILQQECSLGKVGETRFKDQCHPQSDLAVALFCLKTIWLPCSLLRAWLCRRGM